MRNVRRRTARSVCYNEHPHLPPQASGMELDDEVCLCFHVSKRKVLAYLRVEKPRRASQLSECFGAGTGCGWCRAYLQRLFDHAVAGGMTLADDPTPDDYARQRAAYVRSGGGTPPAGATPLPDDSGSARPM
jgi:bacterioferritin-associated ferredoxin